MKPVGETGSRERSSGSEGTQEHERTGSDLSSIVCFLRTKSCFWAGEVRCQGNGSAMTLAIVPRNVNSGGVDVGLLYGGNKVDRTPFVDC